MMSDLRDGSDMGAGGGGIRRPPGANRGGKTVGLSVSVSQPPRGFCVGGDGVGFGVAFT